MAPKKKTTDITAGLITAPVRIDACREDLAKVRADVLVLGVAQGPDGPALLDAPLPPAERDRVAAALPALAATGAPDELLRLPASDGVPAAPALALAGVGRLADAGTARAESLRRAAGSAVRQLAGSATVVLGLPAATVEDVAAIAEGAALGAYAFTAYRQATASGLRAPVGRVLVPTGLPGRVIRPAFDRARAIGAGVGLTRSLVNQPPLDLYPETFADVAVAAAASRPVTVTVLDADELAAQGFGGLTGVGQGSSRGPRLVRVDYAPSGARAHLAAVGKGITFDSGGLSLKPPTGMTTMKSDMAGAAAVLGAVLAAADLGLKVRITGWLCLAENLPSATAQRPSDVITIKGGRTVEVLNTDAEGRLVLADGLVAAGEEKPDLLIDIATLTGAQMVALGTRVSAVMGSEAARQAVVDAASASGEEFWPMPLPADLRSGLDSTVADIANIGGKFGGMLTAGLFLHEFVPEVDGRRVPWAHLDIAGPAFNEGGAWGYTPKEGTGVGVRTLLALAESVARHGAVRE
ncbi:putative cytosol aminopeptidase [Tersicoccus solisilvae]|uniref:Probable cytosol aminopeptidase n=1 Tax=Tersicoccus solisilvae TaxID=1882339 RepID=A0ABQ1PQ05_9MICC|nr:leucyl aminopeptidase [Tersicoccus solisilvae]GGD00997.1 putative cytosol aminopeptidase [Tersicoccus solisilvae]